MTIDYTKLSNGELADFYYSNLGIDPEAEMDETKAIIAEVERRGLSSDALSAEWDELRTSGTGAPSEA